MNNNPNEFDAIDWNLTSWTGSRQEQIRRWKELSFDEILDAQEGMAELAVIHGESDHSSLPQPHIAESAATHRTNEITDDRHEIVLHGCTPEPLMGYLKALGVFRILSEQADADCRAAWKGGTLVLATSISEEKLVEFLYKEFIPTPIVVPWSGSDFFDVKLIKKAVKHKSTPTGSTIIEAFLQNESDRFGNYRDALRACLNSLSVVEIPKKEQMKGNKKADFLAHLRTLAVAGLDSWVDAASALPDDDLKLNSLLGSGGGSDGNTHFSDNFMQNIWETFPDFTHQKELKQDVLHVGAQTQSKELLCNALFDSPTRALVKGRTSSLYHSGAVGGPNAGQGFERKALSNPWDFILAIEGCVAFAGSVSRKLGASRTHAIFPFQTRVSPTAGDSLGDRENSGQEIWLPLWHRSCGYTELKTLLAEGRSDWQGKPSERGVDFAKSIASLGIDRGIESFARYAIVKGRVGGENYNTAAFLGRFDVEAREFTSLLHEADPWIERFRRGCGEKAPARFNTALRHIDSAVFDYCRFGGTERFQAIIIALGQAEQTLTTGIKFRKDAWLHPMRNLSPDWIAAANDGSPEFEIALALAGIEEVRGKLPGIRSHMERVMFGAKGLDWADNSKTFVWNKGCLLRNLIASLDRRLLDSERLNLPHLPLSSTLPASLSALNGFIHTQLDDAKIEQLLWGLILCRQATGGHERKDPSRNTSIPMPRFFPLLKAALCGGQRIYPHSIQSADSHEIMSKLQSVKPDTRILSLLRANRVEEAINLASSRLKNAGIQPAPVDWSSSVESNSELIQRITAALLIPISQRTLSNLLKPVIVIQLVPLGTR